LSEPDRKDEKEKQRLAEALRANLRRRKDQARERREKPDTDDGDGSA
jgi:hypothetical protein